MKNITNVRRSVATLANRLNKKIKNLSNAFKKSWQVIKGHILISKIAGVTHSNRQAALQRLEGYDREAVNVELEREANNRYDANAVKVIVSVRNGGKYHLGYIPADLAEMIAPLLDKGLALVTKFKAVTDGYAHKENRGALITIEM